MRSFSVLATVACAALSYAAPLVNVATSADITPVANVDAEVHVRTSTNLVEVITQVNLDVSIAIAPLTFITSANSTLAAVQPVVDNVKAILVRAIGDVKTLASGVAGGGILGTVTGGLLSVTEVAGSLADLVNLVLGTVGAVLNVVSGADKTVIETLLKEVAGLVGDLLQVVLPLAGGLVTALLPLIGSSITVARTLGVTSLLAGLGLGL
ncbi:hypothetical protein E1B28_005845 [Marasmius oreades]|uniref:Uncharacterized protein n=1 Tax=Marasmius oreades TaxID=181124 RepID=A0A9P7S4D2_9AGAR|nr:uncharacterized protein E1B28_005845 [Marasmius oreades]KAG7095055.1 hypothetical protein E1B28_005845 [Marasmius oreades]